MSRLKAGSLTRLLAIVLFAFALGRVLPAASLNASPAAAENLVPSPALAPPTWGLGVRTDSPALVTWWNHYSTSSDTGFSFGGKNTSQLTAGTKALNYNNSGSSTQAAIATAKQYGLTTLLYNFEGISYNHGAGCQTLVTESAAAASLIHQAGMQFVFAPTGWLTSSCYQQYPAFIHTADVFIFQAEFLQGKDPNIVADIQSFVHAAKTIKPGLPVWVQLSVAPTHGPLPTPTQLASLVTSLETGTPGSLPDQIVIFYFTNQTPMEQLIQIFRTYHT